MKYLASFCGAATALFFVSFSAQAKPILHFTGAQGPPVEVSDYGSTLPGSSPLSVGFSFGGEDADRIRGLMQANLNRRLLLRIGETTVVTPVVKAVMAGAEMEVSVLDLKTYHALKDLLSEKAP